jgi:hypothetical protein
VNVEDCRGDGSSDPGGDYPEPDLIEVVAGQSYGCGRFETGEVHCWGFNSNLYGYSDSPEGLFKTIAASDYTVHVSCEITHSDELNCWGTDLYGTYATMPAGTYIDVAVSHSTICALTAEGSAVCSYEESFGEVAAPPVEFINIDVEAFGDGWLPGTTRRGSTSDRLRLKAYSIAPVVARVGPQLRVQFPP